MPSDITPSNRALRGCARSARMTPERRDQYRSHHPGEGHPVPRRNAV